MFVRHQESDTLSQCRPHVAQQCTIKNFIVNDYATGKRLATQSVKKIYTKILNSSNTIQENAINDL